MLKGKCMRKSETRNGKIKMQLKMKESVTLYKLNLILRLVMLSTEAFSPFYSRFAILYSVCQSLRLF